MGVPFPDIDPYELLNVSKDSTSEEVKKSYRKLCLKYHPDKLMNVKEDEKDHFKLKFEQIQFSHSILNDPKKKKRYDQTGSLEDIDLDDADFDWYEYFSKVKVEITQETIAKDKKEYQGSEDEEEDIIESWVESGGDFFYLFESIPHTEITKDEEERLVNIIENLIKGDIIKTSEKWTKYIQKRKQNFNRFQKKQLKESKQAEELKQLLQKKHKTSNGSLEDIIVKKRVNDMDSLISNLEKKYGAKKSKGNKTSKMTKTNELNDEEFEKLQNKLFNR